MKRANIVFLSDASVLVVNQPIGEGFIERLPTLDTTPDFWTNVKDRALSLDKRFNSSRCKEITDSEFASGLNALDDSLLSELFAHPVVATIFLRKVDGCWKQQFSIADAA